MKKIALLLLVFVSLAFKDAPTRISQENKKLFFYGYCFYKDANNHRVFYYTKIYNTPYPPSPGNQQIVRNRLSEHWRQFINNKFRNAENIRLGLGEDYGTILTEYGDHESNFDVSTWKLIKDDKFTPKERYY
jgi:hypothetical protein